ncbi:hypothetical protein M885DRAFT_502296 [Pelagophyceae sp. CCMP2097]|nr:hypothetical protein M885DRAFT_502296 [Pelagophyceae sp. CCMP2097]
MEYWGLGTAAAAECDVDGLTIDACTVTTAAATSLFGGAHFELECTVTHADDGDAAPTGVVRTAADFCALAACLGCEFPGALVPPVTDAVHGGSHDAAQLFLDRVLDTDLAQSPSFTRFMLASTMPPSIAAADLPGADVVYTVTAGRLTGSISVRDEAADNALAWAFDQERLLVGARATGARALAAARVAARATLDLLGRGGVRAPHGAFGVDASGLSRALEALDDLAGAVASLRAAATGVRTLRERLQAAEAILRASAQSFEGRRAQRGAKPTSAFAASMASTVRSPKRAEVGLFSSRA